MNDQFKKLNEHLGWGNPNKAIWFVGIEEAGGWTKNEFKILKEIQEKKEIKDYSDKEYSKDVINFINADYSNNDENKNYTFFGNWKYYNSSGNLYDNISKICARLNDLNNWQLFKYHYLCCEQQGPYRFNTFITNLFPLGFNSTSVWDEVIDDYKSIFGLEGIESKGEYYKFIKEKTSRFINLKNLWYESEPIATICMGTTYKEDFLICFDKNRGKDYWSHYKESKYRYYKDDNFFIVNHLSYNSYFNLFCDEVINQIKKFIK